MGRSEIEPGERYCWDGTVLVRRTESKHDTGQRRRRGARKRLKASWKRSTRRNYKLLCVAMHLVIK